MIKGQLWSSSWLRGNLKCFKDLQCTIELIEREPKLQMNVKICGFVSIMNSLRMQLREVSAWGGIE